VGLVDADGDLVRDFTVKIGIELAEGSAKLGGKREQETRDGVATFEDLKVEDPGVGMVLRASAPEVPFLGVVESAPFIVEEKHRGH
jgi:hypothetical protein